MEPSRTLSWHPRSQLTQFAPCWLVTLARGPEESPLGNGELGTTQANRRVKAAFCLGSGGTPLACDLATDSQMRGFLHWAGLGPPRPLPWHV